MSSDDIENAMPIDRFIGLKCLEKADRPNIITKPTIRLKLAPNKDIALEEKLTSEEKVLKRPTIRLTKRV